jgi:hypothetical protein
MLRFAPLVAVLALAPVAFADGELPSPYDEHLPTPRFTLGATASALLGDAGTPVDMGFATVGLAGSYRLQPSVYVVIQVVGGNVIDNTDTGLEKSRTWGGRAGVGWEHWGDFASVGVQASLAFTHSRAVHHDLADGLTGMEMDGPQMTDTADSLGVELRFPVRIRLADIAALEIAPTMLTGVGIGSDRADGVGLSAGVYATLP